MVSQRLSGCLDQPRIGRLGLAGGGQRDHDKTINCLPNLGSETSRDIVQLLVSKPEMISMQRGTSRGQELARVLAELARTHADSAEIDGRLDQSFIERFREVGACAAPTSHGGSSPTLYELLDLIRVVATGDGSAGWVAMIYLTSSVSGHWLSEKARDEVFAKGVGTLLAGVLAPRGTAKAVDGGFRLTGRWAFGSGSADADWMGLGAVIDDTPGRTGIFFVPRHEIEIVPTWSVLGLRATSSNDQLVEDAFVADHRVAYLRRSEPHLPSQWRASRSSGCWPRGSEQWRSVSPRQRSRNSSRSVERRPHRVRSGDSSSGPPPKRRSGGPMREPSRHGSISPSEPRRSPRLLPKWIGCGLRLAATAAVEASRRIVDDLYTLAGGSSIYTQSPLQRQLRDIHTATQHMMVGQPTWELTGRVLVGLESRSGGSLGRPPFGCQFEQSLRAFAHLRKPLVVGLPAVPTNKDLLQNNCELPCPEHQVPVEIGQIRAGARRVALGRLFAGHEPIECCRHRVKRRWYLPRSGTRPPSRFRDRRADHLSCTCPSRRPLCSDRGHSDRPPYCRGANRCG